jgi:hypothetical protein
MSGHPGHKEPTPAFFAPLNPPSTSAVPPVNTPPVEPTSTSNVAAANVAAAGPTAWYKTLLHKAAVNKALSLFIVMNVFSFAMGGYILLAPSTETVSPTARAYVPVNQPTPLPYTPAPTNTPTPTPTPSSEEVVTEEPTPEPTQMPTPTPTPDPTANWNSYTNVDYGYTIKYPLNWTAINLGTLEPKIPSYVVFNTNTASTSARSITLSVSTRGYQEQLAIGGMTGYPYTVAGIQGTWQDLRDSDGNMSVSITLPRTNNLLILHAKTTFAPTLYQMLPTLYVSE